MAANFLRLCVLKPQCIHAKRGKQERKNSSERYAMKPTSTFASSQWYMILRCHAVNIYFHPAMQNETYRKTSNISRTLVGNKIVDNSDVVGASPVGAAPTTSSFST